MSRERRVGIIGRGSIGAVVGDQLGHGRVPGCTLAGSVTSGDDTATVLALISRSDVVVEAAGHAALVAYGDAVLDAGTDLVVCSVGALARPDLQALADRASGGARVHDHEHGRMVVVAGALGGFDLLAAVSRGGAIQQVRLTTTKRPSAYDLAPDHPRTVLFSGSARDAALRFPATANVAATVGLATVGLDAVHVDIVSDPDAQRTTHELEVEADLGTYRFTIANRTTGSAGKTSAVVPWSVVVALETLAAHDQAGGGHPTSTEVPG